MSGLDFGFPTSHMTGHIIGKDGEEIALPIKVLVNGQEALLLQAANAWCPVSTIYMDGRVQMTRSYSWIKDENGRVQMTRSYSWIQDEQGNIITTPVPLPQELRPQAEEREYGTDQTTNSC